MFSRYLREVGLVATDLATLYRHFIDWNIKKLFLWVYTLGASLVFSIPFVVMVGLIGYANPDLITNLSVLAGGIQAGRPVTEFVDAVAAAAWPVAGIALAVGGVVLAFLLAFAYSLVLLARVYLGYARGERTAIRSLPLASWRLAKRIVGAFAWQTLVLVGLLAAIALWFAVARYALRIESTLFYGISGAVAGLAIAYLTVRLSFVIGSLAEDSQKGGATLARENWRMFSGSSGLLAIAVALPYFALLIALRFAFDESGLGTGFFGSIAWFACLESVEAMIFVSIYSRVRDGKFFAK